MFSARPSTPDRIDREAPTLRPSGRAVMRQEWRQLLFLHWAVAPEQVRPLLPDGLELDLFEGRAYVGLVPFTMQGVRPEGMPALPLLSRFHETNVRTYVHFEGRDPGVWFFSLEAANPLAVVAARLWFHLPYHAARMSLTRTGSGGGPEAIAYASDRRWPGPRPASTAIRCVPSGPVAPARVGTLEHFLVERYLLYSSRRGRLYRGQVHHAPYPLQTAELLALDESLLAASALARPPGAPLVHFARGVDVEVFALEPVDAAGKPPA